MESIQLKCYICKKNIMRFKRQPLKCDQACIKCALSGRHYFSK